RRWPEADFAKLLGEEGLRSIPIDHSVASDKRLPGGAAAAAGRLKAFLKQRLESYDQDRNHPDRQATSGLSPYLHFGHLAASEMVAALLDQEQWTPDRVSAPNGKNHGFWGVSPAGEAWLDQLLTWREMGFNLAHRQPRSYDKYESLPAWALNTLDQHRDDPRPALYTLEQFELARTHDELWNAAQRELVSTGMMHNYMRMLWGKKILHWTRSPEEALQIMIHLNNKYALDGRDPNSYSGIFWVLGRYDRAWGPSRPVFGNVRYMTSDSARKKLKLQAYLQRFGANSEADPRQGTLW
ncbi:MAG: deoxyribodipyrimidine photolyase, partial [Pirellulales bacterium]|nr:deoxyribodipyrimidine photolyase [Pirellulales bacterium]